MTAIRRSARGTLSRPGVDLSYEIEGAGPPLVLLHAKTLDTRMWDDQFAALTAVATVIRYDARGFGRSTPRDNDVGYTHAGDLLALLDHLGIDTAILAGLSMGGRIAIETALAAPERVTALVLLDTVIDGVPWDPASARGLQAIGERLTEGGLRAAKAAWLAHGFFVPARRQPAVAARLATMVDDYSGIHWSEPDPHEPDAGCRARLSTVTAPATVVIGALDVPCFHHMTDVLATEIPRARKIVVPDAGHMVNMEAPAAVTEILRTIIEVAK